MDRALTRVGQRSVANDTVETDYYTVLEDGRVQCDVCPRHCKMKDGQRGLCFVRMNEGGRVKMTSYGRSSGFCIDPIEKKPLNHFLPGTPVMSFGTAGCNLQCKFCQNWDISKSREIDKLADSARPETIAEAAVATGCRSVAFTYNDPVIFLEYAVDIAQACRERGLNAVAVSAGYINEGPREEFFRHMDAANIDLKAFTQDFYWSLTKAKLEPVLETLKYLHFETNVWYEITNLIIPGHNDDDEELNQMCEWVVENLGVDVPIHFTAFHPDFKMQDVPHTPPATLKKAHAIAKSHGIRYAYTGNVHDPERGSTYCHNCGTKLIGRDWYELSTWQLDTKGFCRNCAAPCAGVFDGPPGRWGRHRRPVRLSAFDRAR